MTNKIIKFFVVIAGLQFLLVLILFLLTKNNPPLHAVFGMALGLFLLWVVIGGLFMRHLREPVKRMVAKIPFHWAVKFVLFATLLALLEEVITVTMTNTAPLYGVAMSQAHITASANYWDVVLSHSVVLFVPMFCIWAWILSRYDVSPEAIFLTWGLSGAFMETISRGPQHWLEVGMWVFVYGLMIYLPAYSLPPNRLVKIPKWWQYPIFFAVVFLGIIPGGIVAAIIKHIRPPHFFPGIQ